MRPDLPLAVERVQTLKGRALDKVFTFHIADKKDADALVATAVPRVQRLVARYWPGPLTLVLPAHGGGDKGVRLPANDFTRDVIRATGPLWMTSVNRSGEPPLCDPRDIEAQFGSELALLCDDGVSPLGNASTVVRCTGPDLEILREGILSTREVLQTAALQIVFVCTGNTCRSPMAEALARRDLAALLKTTPDRLSARGILFHSVGTGTIDGLAASEGSMLAMHELGIDLGEHQSRAATRDLLQRADHIVVLAASHQRAVRSMLPEAAAKTLLLDPSGADIADPYGGDLADYRRARDQIAKAVAARCAEWQTLLAKA
jgi:protein-tyrosine phosphatase